MTKIIIVPIEKPETNSDQETSTPIFKYVSGTLVPNGLEQNYRGIVITTTQELEKMGYPKYKWEANFDHRLYPQLNNWIEYWGIRDRCAYIKRCYIDYDAEYKVLVFWHKCWWNLYRLTDFKTWSVPDGQI